MRDVLLRIPQRRRSNEEAYGIDGVQFRELAIDRGKKLCERVGGRGENDRVDIERRLVVELDHEAVAGATEGDCRRPDSH